MVYVTGSVIATAVVVAFAAGFAIWSYFKEEIPMHYSYDDSHRRKRPPSPPPAYDKHQRRRRHRRSKSRSSNSSDHSSDSKGSYSSGFCTDECSSSSSSRSNSVYSDDSPKVKSDPAVSSRRPGSVDSNSSKSSSRSGSSSSKSKSRMRSRRASSRLDENGFPLVPERPSGLVDSNSTNSSSRSGSSSSKSKSRSGSSASSSSISKCESWSVTSDYQLDENGYSCLRSHCCVTCGDKESDVVTFLPCGGSYLCKKCALKFLDIGNFCCKCGLEIENMSLKTYSY